MQLYPLNLKLEGRRCVVIGGGAIATRKTEGLLRCGARVTVISPELNEDLAALAEEGAIEVLKRPYRRGDLQGAVLAIAGTSRREVNEAVAAEARETGVLVNVVDVPDLCDFYLPARVRRGPLQVTVGTDGVFPGFSKAMRRHLETIVGEEYGPYVEMLGRYRARIITLAGAARKKEAERALLDAPALPLVAEGKLDEAEALLAAALAPYLEADAL